MVWVMGFEGLVRVWLSRPMGYPRHTLIMALKLKVHLKSSFAE